jgi:uncharacterized protein with GYD domain
MAKFLFEASYSPEGLRGLKKEGAAKRRAEIESVVAGLGGTTEAMYFAFGDVDVYLLLDLPDAATASALSFAVNQSGAVSLKTRVLLTAEEVDAAIAKSVTYRAPGA